MVGGGGGPETYVLFGSPAQRGKVALAPRLSHPKSSQGTRCYYTALLLQGSLGAPALNAGADKLGNFNSFGNLKRNYLRSFSPVHNFPVSQKNSWRIPKRGGIKEILANSASGNFSIGHI